MFLPLVKYEHNLSVLAATGILTFMALPDYKPPLFNFQENEVAVPSVQANLLHCRDLWWQVHFALRGGSVDWGYCCDLVFCIFIVVMFSPRGCS